MAAIMRFNDDQQQAREKRTATFRVILLVEVDETLRRAMAHMLRGMGYGVLAVADHLLALDIARDNPLSLIILDTCRFSEDITVFSQKLRQQLGKTYVPLLLIVENEYESRHIEQQGNHYDDYLLKGFQWEELRSCVQALLRAESRFRKPRPTRETPPLPGADDQQKNICLIIEDMIIDLPGRTIMRQNQPLVLRSAVMFDLFVYLAQRPGVVITREQLLEQVWKYDRASITLSSARTVDVHVHWLREVLGDDVQTPQLIQTVRGVGYRFKAQESSDSSYA
jgi:DNA-binding response OmpR family regulator